MGSLNFGYYFLKKILKPVLRLLYIQITIPHPTWTYNDFQYLWLLFEI